MWKGIIEKIYFETIFTFLFLSLLQSVNWHRSEAFALLGYKMSTLCEIWFCTWRWIPSKSVFNLNRQINDVAPLTRDVQYDGPYIDFIINKKLVPITLGNKAASNVRRVRGHRQFNMGIDIARWMAKEEEGSRWYLCACWSLFVIFVTSRLIVSRKSGDNLPFFQFTCILRQTTVCNAVKNTCWCILKLFKNTVWLAQITTGSGGKPPGSLNMAD